MKLILLLLLSTAAAFGAPAGNPSEDVAMSQGVDLNGGPTISTLWKCFASFGYKTTWLRAYTDDKDGILDPDVVNSVKTANSVSYTNFQFYMEINGKANKNGQQMFDEMYYGLTSHGIYFKQAWIKLFHSPYWSNNYSVNREMIQTIINDAKWHNVSMGIITTKKDWNDITNWWDLNSSLGNCNVPLLYKSVFLDGPAGATDPSCFCDFIPFGPWTVPDAKQFATGMSVCGVTVALNSWPGNTYADAEKNPEKAKEGEKFIEEGFIET